MLKVLKCWNIFVPKRGFAKKEINLEMKYLNVAEKNDAAKTIAGQLSNGATKRREGLSVYNKIYEFEAAVMGKKSKMIMTSVSGHLMTFEFLSSYRNWNNVDPQSLFDAPVRKTCCENFTAIKSTLEREVRSCQGLIIWTDCDREGENIGFEIINVCRAIKPNIVVYRAFFSEITKSAVKRALQNLTQPDKRQSDAVDVRSELDLRTGAAITRFQTMRLQRLFPEKISDKLISYGSCQIPTLGFVAERYKEIEAFVSEPFWKIKVTHTVDDLTVEFLWSRNRLFDKQACEDYYLLVSANTTATVESVNVKSKSKWRPNPMDTVELEKLGSRKLKLSAKEVMTIAEKLYTKGVISYPRTETNMFSNEIDLKSLVDQQTGHGVWGSFAQRVSEWGPNPRNGNKSDKAHPPIHPTKMVPNLEGNEGRVYELICRHFLACVSKDAVGSETIVTITIGGEKFTATGLVIYERNYLDVYIYDKWNAKQVHNYEQGQQFEPTEITMPEGHTTAPPLLTEADLIALMDKHGIGTDATHAEHINTIKERGYIGVVDKGCLVPGVIGMGLYEGYDAMDLALAKPMLRAEFEQDLKKICVGEKVPEVVLREQIVKYKEAYKQIMDKITAMDEKMAQRILETPVQNNDSNSANAPVGGAGVRGTENKNRLQELFKCPKCLIAPLALKPKKNQTGFLIGCLNFPDCKNCIWWPSECKDPAILDENCSKCGSEFKYIKFKFSDLYHKTLFNTSTGWYKVCLRCDEQFRNTFNINLESVQRIGAIVGDTSSIPINYGVTQPPPGPANKPKGTSTKTKKSDNTHTENELNTKRTRKSSVKSTITAINTNIRSYFTAAPQTSADEIAASELQDMPIEAFFDSNDGFDDLILSADTNLISPTPVTTLTNSAATTNASHEVALSSDLVAAFNEVDDDVFADIQWGSEKPNSVTVNTTSTLSPAPFRSRVGVIEDSFSEWLQDENDTDDDFVWGSRSKNTRTSENQPAPKKAKLEDLEPTYEENYDWGSQSRVHSEESSISVRCTGCHQLAKELSVKKDGPNKGRLFFVCSKSKPCTFFQWSDEDKHKDNLNGTQSRTGHSTARHSTANTSSSRISETTTEYSNWGSRTNNVNSSVTFRDEDMLNNREKVNCNCNIPASSLTVRKEGPNKGRNFYVCESKSCGFFQWSEDTEGNSHAWGPISSRNTTFNGWNSIDTDVPNYDAEPVDCNCKKPANSLIVRKDGPNKGRPFYACANRNKSCGFFQWADASEDDSQRSWGRSSKAATSKISFTNDITTKGRKCGLCRQEGHRRQKCPRKGEFEY